jgi:hypothetical protein
MYAVNGDYEHALANAFFNFALPALGERSGVPSTPFHGPTSFVAFQFSSGVAQSTNDAITADPLGSDPCGLGRIGADLYIDPSGTVLTTTGIPVEGATVLLSRSDSPSGKWSEVPNRSDMMSLSNRRNPDRTSRLGAFGWDVVPGWYRVTAYRAGCRGPHGALSASTPALQVPPPALNLAVRLVCSIHRAQTDVSLKVERQTVARKHGHGSVTVLSAQVRAAGGRGSPMGTVTFSVGRKRLGTVALGRAGTASLSVPGGAVGVTAAYSGDGRYAPGVSKRG